MPLYRTGTERSMSFNGRGAAEMSEELKRPRTLPDLRVEGGGGFYGGMAGKKVMTKVLMNVTIQGSVGPVQVLITPGNTVAELIMAVVKQYIKEGRRPHVLVNDVDHFDLHYSPFSLECLDREEELAALGSRNFFMFKRAKTASDAANGGCHEGGATLLSFSKQAEKATNLKSPNPWLKLMSFLP